MKNETKKIRVFDLTFFVTTLICVIPLIFGIIVWEKLPEQIAIHFNLHGEPDIFCPKYFSVYVLPGIMIALCILINLLSSLILKKAAKKDKIFFVERWFIPLISTYLCASSFVYSLGYKFNIGMAATALVSMIFILLGVSFPSISVENANIPVEEKAFNLWKKITGYGYILLGLIDLLTAFFPFGTYIFLVSIILFFILTITFVVKVAKR